MRSRGTWFLVPSALILVLTVARSSFRQQLFVVPSALILVLSVAHSSFRQRLFVVPPAIVPRSSVFVLVPPAVGLRSLSVRSSLLDVSFLLLCRRVPSMCVPVFLTSMFCVPS